jgi:hypothetical protein
MHEAAKTVTGGLRHASEVYDVQRRHTGEVSENAIRRYVRELLKDKGIAAEDHPIGHRLVAAPLAQLLTLRDAPGSYLALLRWQLGWPGRYLRRTRARAEQR